MTRALFFLVCAWVCRSQAVRADVQHHSPVIGNMAPKGGKILPVGDTATAGVVVTADTTGRATRVAGKSHKKFKVDPWREGVTPIVVVTNPFVELTPNTARLYRAASTLAYWCAFRLTLGRVLRSLMPRIDRWSAVKDRRYDRTR